MTSEAMESVEIAESPGFNYPMGDGFWHRGDMGLTPDVPGWSAHVKLRYPSREQKRVEAVLRVADRIGADIIVTEPALNKGLRIHATRCGFEVAVDVVSGKPYKLACGEPGRMMIMGGVRTVAEVAILLRMLREKRS